MKQRHKLWTSLILASASLAGCVDYENIPEFKKLENRKVTVEDDEIEAILKEIQRRILEGEIAVASVEEITNVLGITSQVTEVLVEDFTLSEAREAALRTKLATYLALAPGELSSGGWIENCDSLLFTSLMKAGGHDVELSDAEDDGKWYRRPDVECFSEGLSESTISRDMMLGLAMGIWQEGGAAGRGKVERALAYAKANAWYIGEASDEETRIARAYMSASLAATYYELQHKLGGEEVEARKMPMYWSTEVEGFTAHLQVLHILLRGLMRGGISVSDLASLAHEAERQPENALYAAAVAAFTNGNMNAVADTLLNEAYFPAASLPTAALRCEPYLWQRDFGEDWEPCDSGETHEGSDFIFLAKLVLNELRRFDGIDPDFE